ncbi:MAG: hypothetical protein HC941_23600 [Microcoleus sp. SU_5_3]|nr:hypothetical protein [Microcoleus sp. SU_5_3]
MIDCNVGSGRSPVALPKYTSDLRTGCQKPGFCNISPLPTDWVKKTVSLVNLPAFPGIFKPCCGQKIAFSSNK